MARLAWVEEPIARRHDRSSFDCGATDLNDYLLRYARQNHRGGGAKTFVAVPTAESPRVLGYYTLSPTSIAFARVPEIVRRGLGRYDVPGFRLARLAVDRAVQGRGLGSQLLLAAGERCLAVSAAVGGVALAIDAKDDSVAAWYETLGAVRLLDAELQLVIPLATIAEALAARSGS